MPAGPSPLGEFELVVLLAVLHCAGHGTGVAIRDGIESRTGRNVGRGAVYVTLDRLEAKGLLTSRAGPSSPERGGHPRRFFSIAPAGVKAVRRSLATLQRMHAGLEPVLGDL